LSAARGLQAWLDRADALASAGRYFDAHEELEAPWKAASGDERLVLQGLIQVAAGLHRLRLKPEKTEGAFYLLERGLDKLRRGQALLDAQSLAALERAIADVRRAGRAPERLRFGLRAAVKG
jgi:hypothetical protein